MRKYFSTYIINKINDIPIRQKFIIIFVVLILIPLFTVYMVFFTRLSDEISLREQSVVVQSTNRVISDIKYLVDSCFTIARDVAVDQEINEMVSEEYSSSAEYFNVYYEKLRDQIQMYATGYNNVIRVSIYTDNPTVLSGGNIYKITEDTKKSDWYQASASKGFNEIIVSWVEKHTYLKDVDVHKISVIRKMDEFSQIENDMFIRIDIEENKLKNILQETYDIDFVITDSYNKLIADNSTNIFNYTYIESFFEPSQYESENTLTSMQIYPSKGVKWLVYTIIPKQTLTDLVRSFGGLIALILIVSIGFSTVFIFIFSGSYNDRIQLLIKHMYKVEHSEFVTIKGNQGSDEIGDLISAFNRMTIRVNGLVNEVLKFKLKEKEHQLEQVKAELKFLQSQMDPHFLFNTLNAILVVSSRNDYHEITNIIKYLAKTMRYLIEWDDSMVPIEKELTYTMMYLEIEKFRFRDKFDFNIEVGEEVTGILVPKLSIQPFVENACKHGLQASKSKGKLLIHVFQKDMQLNIIIKDNGIGMSSEKLEKIYTNDTDTHIGITNVLKRLKIHYSNSYEFNISSQIDAGTEINLKIPVSAREASVYEKIE